ncbi:MAG TPA: SGNH/GDSL hydrolase family protein [Steroidobacteraceae bacterium]|nr:SGNH/GDSL hydrolase family protein [Steroidobacteraceae bacterium]
MAVGLALLAVGGWILESPVRAEPAAQADPAPTGFSPPPPPTFLEVANLAHYAQANAELAPLSPRERRVVFIGDSITEGWRDADPQYFLSTASISRVDRGISGQTSPQMLLRFQQDVIALRPIAVHILAGTNDLAGNWGAMPLEITESMIASMAELARANGIRVIIGSVLPASDFPWRRGLNPGPAVVKLNEWLRAYCRTQKLTYVDYYSAMTDGKLGMPPDLASDGIHPTPAGYQIMKTLADAAIKRALKSRDR